MTEKTEALRLADRLERDPNVNRPAIAAELRRLSIENDALGLHLSERIKDLARVEAQRDALLEALRPFAETDLTTSAVRDTFGFNVLFARAAIKAVEGENHAKNL